MTNTELELAEPRRQRNWWLRVTIIFQPSKGKRRVWDRMQELEHELAKSRETIIVLVHENDDLRKELASAGQDLDSKLEMISYLQRELKIAINANEANKNRITVPMMVRDTGDMEDQATVPVPIVDLNKQPRPGSQNIDPFSPVPVSEEDTRPIVTLPEPATVTKVRKSNEHTHPEIDVRKLRASVPSPTSWAGTGTEKVVLTLQQAPFANPFGGPTYVVDAHVENDETSK